MERNENRSRFKERASLHENVAVQLPPLSVPAYIFHFTILIRKLIFDFRTSMYSYTHTISYPTCSYVVNDLKGKII